MNPGFDPWVRNFVSHMDGVWDMMSHRNHGQKSPRTDYMRVLSVFRVFRGIKPEISWMQLTILVTLGYFRPAARNLVPKTLVSWEIWPGKVGTCSETWTPIALARLDQWEWDWCQKMGISDTYPPMLSLYDLGQCGTEI